VTDHTVVPYGSWPSPFPIELLAVGVVSLAEPRGRDGVRWWLEGRPDEKGRQVLVRRDRDGTVTRLTPEGFNARDRVHEYGGAAYVLADDEIVVSDFATGRLQRIVGPERLEPLTPERRWRYADLVHDAPRGRLIAVREDHEASTIEQHGEARNELVAIDLGSGAVEVLVTGADFYAAPRLSPDASQLAWLQWHHPNLPWDGTELQLSFLDAAGRPGPPRTIAGGQNDWVTQPRWSPDGVLHFIAEPTGWTNLYRSRGGRLESIAPMEAEFGHPDWVFGISTYAFLDDGTIVAVARSGGLDRLYRIAPGQDPEPIDLPFTELGSLAVDGDHALSRAGGPSDPVALIDVDLATGGWTVLRRSTAHVFDPEDIAFPQPVEFPTTGDRTAFGLYYRPTNQAFKGPVGERPPLVVTSHGGPTSQAWTGFSTPIQLYTSRGFAVLDVDYGGSTGHGREYRKRLEGMWGLTDVDDCAAGARWLAERGEVDPDRIAIRGGSASGYTTLAALAFTDTFRAGVSYYGLGDLLAFARETHKFESRYLDRLVGPLPEAEATYRERSPALHADRITCPVLVLQGAEDRIVPPAEAERIVDALFERGVPHAYLLFAGEDHGFRSADTIIHAFGAELSFLGQVFGFTPADELPPLELIGPPRQAGQPTPASR
jgi:dipeptidyl aminopeptidase/acylaminoacyl peptidase